MAALTILAFTLVVVLANAQKNTARERAQAKSFHVAEAALDAAMANISLKWPGPTATPEPFPTATFQQEFKPDSGESAEYPGPAGADVPDVAVTYFDDFDTNGDGLINAEDEHYGYDANGNDRMFIVAQGGVLKRASRVQALVQRGYFEPQVPSSNVLVSDGDLLNSGGGGGVMPKVTIEDPGPLTNGEVAVDVLGDVEGYYDGLVDDAIDTQFGTGPDEHNSPNSLDEVFPPSAREAIISYAKRVGRYFDEENASPGKSPFETALASPQSKYGDGGPGLRGLTVVKQTAADDYNLGGNLFLNSENDPGILMLQGPIDFSIHGTAQFYGLLYLEEATISAGTLSIHGALFSTTDIDFRGTLNLMYNYMALAGLTSEPWGSTVSMVPNTWRELQPK
jgi:hypothetical protein